MKYRLLAVLTLALFALMGVSVLAQEDCEILWHAPNYSPNANYADAGEIVVNDTDSVTVTAIDGGGGVWLSGIETDGNDICRIVGLGSSEVTGTTPSSTGTVHCGDDRTHPPDNFDYSFAGGPANAFYTTGTGPYTITYHFDPIDGCAPEAGPLIRPFSADDENVNFSGGLYDNSIFLDIFSNPADFIAPHDPAIAFAWSNTSDAYVMAAGDGTITNIEPFYDTECSLLGFLLADTCLVVTPDNVYATAGTAILYLYEASTVDAYKVTLQLDTGEELVYWARKANQYVNVGIHISGGCILGLAMPATPLKDNNVYELVSTIIGTYAGYGGIATFGNFLPDSPTVGLVFVGKTDLEDEVPLNAYAPVVSELTQYADPDEACNIDPRLAGCLVNDPELRDSSQWQTDGPVQWFPTPGIELDPGGTVYQQLNLAPDTSYHMIVSLFPSPTILGGKPAEVTLSLGDQHQAFSISPGGTGQYEMTVTPAPDLGGAFYTVRVSNTGQAWFIISGICVGEEGRQIVPSDCLVNNSNFDYDLSNWTASGGVEWVSGKALVPSGDTLAQTITLPPGDYEANIQVFVWNNIGWDGTGDISLDVTWPDEVTPDTIATIPTWNLPGNLGFPAIPQLIHSTFTVASDTTGDFILSPTTSDNEDVLGIKIDKVCITEVGSDSGGFNATCDVVSEPSDDSFGAWISYHWQQLNRFFQCDLMVFLNKLLGVIQAFFKTSTWVMRYFVASTQYGGQWANTYLFPWLNGHFRNIAVGQVTVVNSESGCHDFFCAVTSLFDLFGQLIGSLTNLSSQIIGFIISLVNQVVTLVLTILNALITLVLLIVGQIFGLLQLGQSLLASIITAYNTSTPTPIPGAPNCTNPQNGGFCIALWVLDNTIFSGPGAAFIPILVGFFSINLILWAISDLKKTTLELGSAS